MSKIARRNYVKKNMDKFHKPKKELSDKLYTRKNNKIKVEELDEQVVNIPIRQGLHQ